jgi:Uma2 family endonuclease
MAGAITERLVGTRRPEPAIPPFPVERFTVDEYLQIVREGILPQDRRFELLEGWIVPKLSRNPPRDSALNRLQRRLILMLGDAWVVRGQSAARLSESVPEPDIAVAIGPEARYDDAHPTYAEMRIAIEVADSSLSEDRTLKLRIYARNRIPEYWIVNLVNRRVEAYKRPRSGRVPSYRIRTIFGLKARLPVVLDGKSLGEIIVADILP